MVPKKQGQGCGASPTKSLGWRWVRSTKQNGNVMQEIIGEKKSAAVVTAKWRVVHLPYRHLWPTKPSRQSQNRERPQVRDYCLWRATQWQQFGRKKFSCIILTVGHRSSVPSQTSNLTFNIQCSSLAVICEQHIFITSEEIQRYAHIEN